MFFEVFFWNRNKTIMVEDTLNLMAHIIKEIKFPIYFIHNLFLFDSPFTIYWEFWGDYGLKKTYFELPLQNQCQGICFRVKEYVFRVKESNEMGFKSKTAIFTYVATMKIRCRIRFF